jgi:hypothetical protein
MQPHHMHIPRQSYSPSLTCLQSAGVTILQIKCNIIDQLSPAFLAMHSPTHTESSPAFSRTVVSVRLMQVYTAAHHFSES